MRRGEGYAPSLYTESEVLGLQFDLYFRRPNCDQGGCQPGFRHSSLSPCNIAPYFENSARNSAALADNIHLTICRPLLPYVHSYKASRARPGYAVFCNF